MASKTPILQTEIHSVVLLCAVVSFAVTLVVLFGGGPHSSVSDGIGQALNKMFTLLLFGAGSFIVNITGLVFAGVAMSNNKTKRKNKQPAYLVGGFYLINLVLAMVAYSQPM